MPSFKMDKIFPCAKFFADGRTAAGIMALLMQLTLVLWPFAARWATQAHERQRIERLLDELSEANIPTIDPYARAPRKKFRQMAL
ncbi:hypothetical protein [Acidocella sp.]|uniref:hypothetical protein n=2 Tax=Acidocella sp. TaxID=50710 RepID=UPI002635CFF1|nr:hypothetical protein [Acidocella sp.]